MTRSRSGVFVDWTLRHGRLLWLIALVLCVPAVYRTAQLYRHMKSDVEELLPRESQSVVALEEMRSRMDALHFLGIVVDTTDAAHLPAGEKFVDDLAARVRAYPNNLVRAVRTGDGEERRFLADHAPLYIDLDDLKEIHKRISARRDWEVSHQLGTALGEDEPAPPLDFSDIKKKYEAKAGARPSHPNDRFSDPNLHATVLLIQVSAEGIDAAKLLMEKVRADVASLGPSKYGPLRIGYAADIAISVEETQALLADLSISTIVVVFAVLAAILLYYRWWRSILVLFPPLFVATFFAFGLASLPPFSVTELNANTAFLGSIIVGNGINFGIILLARYVEERRAGLEVHASLVRAIEGSRAGTLAAALAAGASYVSLVVTQFRGFRQFGFIGGIGMVCAWLFAYLLMPPLIAWLDRDASTAPPPKEERSSVVAWIARFVRRFPTALTAVTCVLLVLAAWNARKLGPSQIETDFGRLRRADTWTSGEGYWSPKLNAILGEYLTPIALLTDDPAQARALAARTKDAASKPPLSEAIMSVRTADDALPLQQKEKIDEVNAIKEELTPKIRSLLSDEQRSQISRFLGDKPLQPITLKDLPGTFTIGLLERDATTIDRTVLVYPRFSDKLWKGQPLADFIAAMRAIGAEVAHDGKPARVAGSLPISADILSSISKDGPTASFAALIGVILVVLLIFRGNATTWWVIASLVMGVLWLASGMIALGVKINFANFIAFPITFGIGVDYAVNVMSRYVQDGKRDILLAVRTVGSAVALCSLTTIIGYSSLLLAENRALFLFGLVAVLGEVACLVSAIVALPAVLIVLQRRRDARA